MFHLRRTSVVSVALLAILATTHGARGQNVEPSSQPEQTERDELGQLIATLQSDGPLFDKAKACQRLAVIGTEEAVPALAALLSDEKLANYARFGLEAIPGQSVDEALRGALAKLDGKLLIGVINSIGNRRDNRAVDQLNKLLTDGDPEVASAAAAALGQIGSPGAAELLKAALKSASADVSPSFAEACLTCGQRLASEGHLKDALVLYDAVRKAALPKHVLIAATRGAILVRRSAGIELLVEQLRDSDQDRFEGALRVARELAGQDVTETLLNELDDLSSERQAKLLLAIADRGDAAALPAVLEAAETGPADVRVAAFRCLAELGDASAVPVLLDAAVESSPEVAKVARDVLVAFPGSQVDEMVVSRLGQGDGEVRRVLIDLAGRRRIESAVPALMKAADDPDEQVRVAAIKALGTTISLRDLSTLINRAIDPKTSPEQAAAQDALAAACIRMTDRELCAKRLVDSLPEAPLRAKCFLLDLLGELGGDEALKAVAAGAREPNEEIQDTATRVLGEWMTPDAAGELLDLAKTLPDNRFRIRVLRGYVRIARQLNVPAGERLTMCRNVLRLAWRDTEKKLALDVLARNPSQESLLLVVSQLEDPALQKSAITAALAIAEKIVDEAPDPVSEAMKQVLKVAEGQSADRAKALLDRATPQQPD